MDNPPPDDAHDPTSEVGSVRAESRTEDLWRLMFEQQTRNMKQLIEAIKGPSISSAISMPEYNPDTPDSDARAWSNTVDLILSEQPLQGAPLIIALSKALKGSASSWLSQISYSGMTWPDFQSIFLCRFDLKETSAATIIKLTNTQPKDGEALAAYASRLVSSLITKWNGLTTEQIAVASVLAHVSKFDSRVHHLAHTTDVTSRTKLQQELNVFTQLKRKFSSTENTDASEPKRSKLPTPVCHYCGIVGHKANMCRKRAAQLKSTSSSSSSTKPWTKPTDVVCYRCGQSGHIAPSCPNAAGPSNGTTGPAGTRGAGSRSGPAVERRVESCEVQPITGVMKQSSESFSFCYDSGAECSLIRESKTYKLSGKRQAAVVNISGIGNSNVLCSEQILSEVEINDFRLEVLFHVIPDEFLRHDIMIGREILKLGFSITMTENSLVLSKVKVVDQCSVSEPINFSNVNTDIPTEYKPELIKILQEYSKSFVDGLPTTRVNSGELKLRLIDSNKTVQRRPYRLTPEERQLVRSKINDMKDAGIIQPSCSPFASPILLVKKKDGADRMCVDYRELNSNTVPDKFPLPIIADQIARLCGAYFYTVLDCCSGFHQIPIHPDSVEMTAFVTPDGQFEYLAMPFGLRNAPSVFQRAVTNALGELVYSYVIIYIDDIMIPSKDPSEGLERLKEVLECLSKSGFSLNFDKCSFLKQRVEYLGYEVTAGEIRPNPRKIEALTHLQPPKTIHQLRQFIGLASYFRKFVPNFSQVMKPLFLLTTGKATLKWKDEHEQIRQKIISTLTDAPVLMIYDPEHPVELHTDASADGYGAILFQRVDNKLYVVEYFSKRTTPAESRYHSYELETIAVVNAIKHFRHYLQGRKFTVVTDCNSLKASRNKIDLTPRVHRWWAYLQAFDFDIVYREGKNMSHVDFLSRNPSSQIESPVNELTPNPEPQVTLATPTKKVEQKRVDITTLSSNWLLAEQQRDAEVSLLISKLNDNSLSDEVAQTYELRSGVLYRKIQRKGKTCCLPIVPRALRWSVINHIHESIMHLGWEKTLEKVYEHYWFENMSKYVRKFVDNCVTCKVSKSHSGKVQAELHPIPKVNIPWHTVHVDVTGKLSGKSDRKEYIIVLIDAFTKYILLYHTLQIDAASSIKALKSSVSLFGTPTRIIADQGRCFASKNFKEFCDSHNIALHLIATGSCRANGQVERQMRTLKGMLTAVETSERSWQDAIGDVQLALNCTVNRVTQASPLELMIGRVARPLDLMNVDDESEVNLSQVREQAASGITENASYDKIRFDKSKAKFTNFSVGDYVLIENEERNQTKLDPKFKGPFKVIEVLEGDRYLLKSLTGNRTYKYAHDRIRKMPESSVPVDIDDDDDIDADDNSGDTGNSNLIHES